VPLDVAWQLSRDKGSSGQNMRVIRPSTCPHRKDLNRQTVPVMFGISVNLQSALTQGAIPLESQCTQQYPPAARSFTSPPGPVPPVTGHSEMRQMRHRVSYLEPIVEIVESVPAALSEDNHSAKSALLPMTLPASRAWGTEGENLVLDSTKDKLSCVNVLRPVIATINLAAEPQHLWAL